MINTNYGNLGNYFDSQKLLSGESSKNSMQNKPTNTIVNGEMVADSSDIAVILSLSNEESCDNINMSKTYTFAKVSASNASVLKIGSKGAKVKTLQKNLTKLGYDTKGTDGIFGNDTKKAVIEFQKAYGLTADGMVGSQTQNKINQALDYYNKGILAVGSRGKKVKTLQKNLTSLGYNAGAADGIFGAGTKKAVIAFQKAHGLTADGIVGSATQNAINKALKENSTSSSEGTKNDLSNNSKVVQKMINNLRNDTSLGLSKDKKTAMITAAERLLNDGYEVEFVAGVLGNIQNEGTPGIFESSNYSSNPSAKPSYLKYMDEKFNYASKFSGKSICEVGISATVALQEKVKASGYKGKFGFGMIQWTGSRTEGVLKAYQKYIKKDKPTMEDCIKAEVNFMADELKGDYAYVYTAWKKGDRTASSAGDIVCRKYEIPADTDGQAKLRAKNASKIYNVMMK